MKMKNFFTAVKVTITRIFKIFKHDMRKIFTNLTATIVALGVMLLPSLYAWFNILASWDPYGNTNYISVAVANVDKGYTIRGLELNIGDSIIQSLAENNQIGWVFTHKDDAIQGVRSGTYYAAVVIPEDFSQNIASILTPTITKPSIDYYVNEKKNAIAPKITDKGVSVIQQKVNATFISESCRVLGEALLQITNDLDNAGITEYSGMDKKLSESVDFSSVDEVISLIDDINGTFDNFIVILETFNSTASSVNSLLSTVQNTLTLTDQAVSSAIASQSTSAENVATIGSTLNNLSSTLSIAFESVSTASGSTKETIEQALASANEDAATAANYLTAASGRLTTLISITDQMIAILNSNSTIAALPNVQTLLAKLNTTRTSLTKLQTSLASASTELAQNQELSKKQSAELKQLAEENKRLIDDAFGAFKSSTSGEIASLAATLGQNLDNIIGVVNSLQLALPVVNANIEGTKSTLTSSSSSINSLIHLMKNSKERLNNAKTNLSQLEGNVVSQLQEVEGKIDDTLAIDWKDKLENVLGVNLEEYQNSPEEIGEFLSSPVELNTSKIYTIENYGSALSPFYTILCLWVGGLVLVSILKCDAKSDDSLDLSEYKHHQLYLGRYMIFMLFATIQALIACLGDLYILKIQCLHPGLFVLAGVVAAIVFSNVVYTLTISFGDVGKAIAVILLVLQVAGAGGTFPIEVTPSFFNKINPFLPFTHGITAMRETIGGLYENTYVLGLLKMVVYLPFSLLFGTVFRQPLIALSHFFERRVKDTNVM